MSSDMATANSEFKVVQTKRSSNQGKVIQIIKFPPLIIKKIIFFLQVAVECPVTDTAAIAMVTVDGEVLVQDTAVEATPLLTRSQAVLSHVKRPHFSTYTKRLG